MFGFSFGEFVLLLIVAIILVGPRQLPSVLRTAGQWVAKLRRMAFDMRSQSGIDQLLRDEGLERDLRELRRLLAIRRGNVLDALTVDIGAELDGITKPPAKKGAEGGTSRDDVVTMVTEFPLQGADSYGAVPEDVAPYLERPREEPVEQQDTRGGSKQEPQAANVEPRPEAQDADGSAGATEPSSTPAQSSSDKRAE